MYVFITIYDTASRQTEIYKTEYNLNLTFMTQVFEEKDVPYNFRETTALPSLKIRQRCMVYTPSGILEKNMAGTPNRNQGVPITRDFQTKN